ncbi:MAG: baseplate J/gp47 family protein [Rhodospirillales bacterium]
MPFERPTLSELVARSERDIEANMPGSEPLLAQGVLPALLRAHAGTAFGLYGFLDVLRADILPDTADAAELARHASIWGIARKPATAAIGAATITGTNGTVVPAATALVRSDGTAYRTTAVATIAGGTATLTLTADIAGAAANAAGGVKLRFVSPIGGVSGEALVVAGSGSAGGLAGGTETESDASLLARLLARIQSPPQGGALADYLTWALEVPGVTRAWVSPGELGLGTVTLRFAMDGRPNPIPLPADVATVAAHIETVRPVTAQVTVVAPIALPIDFQVRIVPATPAVQAAVEAELRDLVARDSAVAGTVLLSRMREAISVAAGETDNQLVAPTANVVAGVGELPTFGSIAWVP